MIVELDAEERRAPLRPQRRLVPRVPLDVPPAVVADGEAHHVDVGVIALRALVPRHREWKGAVRLVRFGEL